MNLSSFTGLDLTPSPKFDAFRQFVELTKAKRKLEGDLKQLEAELAVVATQVEGEMVESGMTNLAIDGMTVYLQKDIWAYPKDGDRPALAAALRDAGDDYGWMVEESVNIQRLSGWFREALKSGAVIPQSVRDQLDVKEGYKVLARAKK